MLKDDLKELSYKLVIIEKCSETEFENFFELSLGKGYEPNEKIDNVYRLCECFWLLCINLDVDESSVLDMTFGKKILELVGYIAASLSSMDKVENSEELYPEKGMALIKFLNCIANFENVYFLDEFDFIEFYGKLNDVMDRLKWIFALEQEAKKVFPINRLLDRVVTDFKMDDTHYLQLIFSLQIFNSVGEISENPDIKDSMLEIAKKYNIAIIEMLCNNGKLLYGESAGINSIKNGTIIVVQDKRMIIRNVDQTYFEGSPNIQQELSDSLCNDAVAYYIDTEIESNCKIVSFYEILKGENYYCKQILLSEIFEKGYYNIFLDDMIFIDAAKKDFLGFVNPFGRNDVAIIGERNDVFQNGDMFKDFLDILAKDKKGLRSCLIKENNLNVISLDFLIEFYRVICQQPIGVFLQKMIRYSGYVLYQNQMIEDYFEYALEVGEIKAAIEKYNIFIENYINFLKVDENIDMAKMAHLIMPYKLFLPFDGDINHLYEALLHNDYFNYSSEYKLEKIVVKREIGNKKKYFINEKEIKSEDIIDLDGVVSEHDIVTNADVFYSDLHSEVITLTGFERIKNIFKHWNKQNEIAIIEATDLGNFYNSETIIKLINNIGMSERVYSYFGCSWKDAAKKNICLYKFLWHVQIYQLLGDRYYKFEDLVLKKYYTKFVLKPEVLISKFVEKLKSDDEDKKLIIAKEVDGEGATLNYVLEKECSGERGTLKMAFSSEKITSKVSKNAKDRYEFLGNEIDTVVFITDNILSGGSTSQMLNYYINDIKNPKDKRTYLWEGSSNIVASIIQKNKPKIELRTIFCTKVAKEKLESKWKVHRLHITSEDVIGEEEFKWTKEVEDIVCELYDIEPNSKQSESYKCIFRINNMPYEEILPKKIKDTSRLVGIFMRRNEV